MSSGRRIVRAVFAALVALGFVLSSGCGVMFGNTEEECTGSCGRLTDCSLSACGCKNNVARLGMGCSGPGGCCIHEGYVCDQACEGHGGVAKIDRLGCNFVASCQQCLNPTCQCWDGSALRGGCVNSYDSDFCCVTGVKDWTAYCHGLCANYGGLKGVTP